MANHGSQLTDEQLKKAVGAGLGLWILLSFAGVPLIGGIAAVVAAGAGAMLLVRKSKA